MRFATGTRMRLPRAVVASLLALVPSIARATQPCTQTYADGAAVVDQRGGVSLFTTNDETWTWRRGESCVVTNVLADVKLPLPASGNTYGYLSQAWVSADGQTSFMSVGSQLLKLTASGVTPILDYGCPLTNPPGAV